MKSTRASIEGLLIIEPTVFGDERGFFMEAYSRDRYAEMGLPREFVQDNLSLSARGILRGLHLQHPKGQGKLCQVLEGEVLDVAVDVRVGSPTFGSWEGVRLSSENKRQLYVPPGFAHGFCVLSERALFSYKCTRFLLGCDRDRRRLERSRDRHRLADRRAPALGQGREEPTLEGHSRRRPSELWLSGS